MNYERTSNTEDCSNRNINHQLPCNYAHVNKVVLGHFIPRATSTTEDLMEGVTEATNTDMTYHSRFEGGSSVVRHLPHYQAPGQWILWRRTVQWRTTTNNPCSLAVSPKDASHCIAWIIKCSMWNNSNFSPRGQWQWYNGLFSFIASYPSCSYQRVLWHRIPSG